MLAIGFIVSCACVAEEADEESEDEMATDDVKDDDVDRDEAVVDDAAVTDCAVDEKRATVDGAVDEYDAFDDDCAAAFGAAVVFFVECAAFGLGILLVLEV